ncbi:MAG: hypothetical protein V4585_23030 [Bacteroidota bacterium]
MQINEEIADNEIFTFDDWLSYKVFYHVEDGVQLCNDSRNFTKLFRRGGMRNDTFKKIREEQLIVYKGIVNQKLEFKRTVFKVTYILESNVPMEYLRMKIESVEQELTKVEYKKYYFDFVSGNKYGQSLISPTDYRHFHNTGWREFRPDSYEGLIKNNDERFDFSVNMWVEIEATYYFLEWLKELQSGKFSLGFSDDNRVVEISTPPALKEIEQRKVSIREPYKSEKDIIEELDKFKKAVTDICLTIKGLSNNQFPTIAQIKTDALRHCGLTERVINLNIKNSTTLIKTGLSPETTTGHIRQIVGQFFKGNNLILKKLKLNT